MANTEKRLEYLQSIDSSIIKVLEVLDHAQLFVLVHKDTDKYITLISMISATRLAKIKHRLYHETVR